MCDGMDKETLLKQIMALDFAINDLSLYLDIFPNDSSLVNLHKQYNKELDEIKNKFEKEFYPLVSSPKPNRISNLLDLLGLKVYYETQESFNRNTDIDWVKVRAVLEKARTVLI